MTKEEYIEEILKMSKEMLILTEASLDDLKKLYIQTKIVLDTFKSTLKDEEDKEGDSK